MQKGQAPFSLHETGQAVIVVLLVMLIAGFVSVFFYASQHVPQLRDLNNASATPNSSPTTSPLLSSIDETANWKIYYNSGYNFSLKYPNNWDKLETGNGASVRFFQGIYKPDLPLPKTYISIQVNPNNNRQQLRDWLVSQNVLPAQKNTATQIREKIITIGSVSGIEVTTPTQGSQDTVYLSVGSNILQATYFFIGEDQKEYDNFLKTFSQIISTFKLLDINNVNETAEWKTYENKTFLYQIKYPADWSMRNVLSGKSLPNSDSLVGINPGNNFTGEKDEINIEVVKGKTAEEIIKSFKKNNTLKSSGDFSIGDIVGKKAEITYSEAGSGGILIYTLFEHDGYLYILSSRDYALKTFSQMISTFKFLETDSKKQNYTCPKNGWENCMPILTPEAQKQCSKEALAWKKKNCPNFKGVAQ